jgi:hypothetical protein
VTWTAGAPLGPRCRGSLLPGNPRRSSPDSSHEICPSQHQCSRLNCLFDNRNLGLVELEVDNFPWFRFPPRQLPLYFPLELPSPNQRLLDGLGLKVSRSEEAEYRRCLRKMRAEGIDVNTPDDSPQYFPALDITVVGGLVSLIFNLPSGLAGYAIWLRLVARRSGLILSEQ